MPFSSCKVPHQSFCPPLGELDLGTSGCPVAATYDLTEPQQSRGHKRVVLPQTTGMKTQDQGLKNLVNVSWGLCD